DLRNFEWHYRDRQAHAQLAALPLPDAPFPSLSPDGTRVVSEVQGQAGAVIKVWDAGTGGTAITFAPQTRFGRMPGMNGEAKFSPDGTRILLPGYVYGEKGATGIVGVWEAATGKPLFAAPISTEKTGLMPRFACLSPDGRYFASEAEGPGEKGNYVF